VEDYRLSDAGDLCAHGQLVTNDLQVTNEEGVVRIKVKTYVWGALALLDVTDLVISEGEAQELIDELQEVV
jgi:hypothetical protein